MGLTGSKKKKLNTYKSMFFFLGKMMIHPKNNFLGAGKRTNIWTIHTFGITLGSPNFDVALLLPTVDEWVYPKSTVSIIIFISVPIGNSCKCLDTAILSY